MPWYDLAGDGRLLRAAMASTTTLQEHIAPNTTSDFAFKGALRDEATAVWRGMIRVEPDAQKTNAYQENRNLLLSPKAHQLHPRSRDPGERRPLHPWRDGEPGRPRAALLRDGLGLTKADAERLILRGFFQDVLDRIELEPVREALGEALEARIPQS